MQNVLWSTCLIISVYVYFLMNVSSYAWAQVTMWNQSLWMCWKQKVPWNSGTDSLNYIRKGKEKCWQIGQNNCNRGSSLRAGKGKVDEEECIRRVWSAGKRNHLAEEKSVGGRREMQELMGQSYAYNGRNLRLRNCTPFLLAFPFCPSSPLPYKMFVNMLFKRNCSPVKRNGPTAQLLTEASWLLPG